MNCTAARDSMPGLLYGDLPPAEAVALREHLDGCAACQAFYPGLSQLRRMLDAAPNPRLTVDLPRLYEQAARLKDRQTRLWRRVTVGLTALAAGLVLVVALRLEIRLDNQQLLVRWGAAPAPPVNREALPPTAPEVIVPDEVPIPTITTADLQLIKELIHALAADIDTRDRRQQAALSRLQERLDVLQTQSDRRWVDTRRNVTALYTAQFGPREKGAQQ